MLKTFNVYSFYKHALLTGTRKTILVQDCVTRPEMITLIKVKVDKLPVTNLETGKEKTMDLHLVRILGDFDSHYVSTGNGEFKSNIVERFISHEDYLKYIGGE